MTVVNDSILEGGTIEFLILTDFLVGMNMKEGGYYQTYFQFPSATEPGLYDSYTCTSEFSNYDELSPFY